MSQLLSLCRRAWWLPCCAWVGVAAPALAEAWRTSIPFRATVHDHVFDRVDAASDGCTLKTKLYFTAPPHAYRSDASVRNHYRFKARVTFRNGKTVESGVFYTRGPARRSYTFVHDTTAEGCWARAEQHPSDVRVEGCRGEGCRVQPFQG